MDYKKELEELVSLVLKEGASDLHLAQGRHPIVRVNGALIPLIKKSQLTKIDMEGFVKELVTPANKEIFDKEKEVDFSYSLTSLARFRGNAFNRQEEISIALRLIPKKIPTFADLNLPTILETFTRKKQGFFMVVGPIGQGKSTTLASMVEMINQTRAEHIVTIEDPIEYVYESKKSIIDQREVRVDTVSFHAGLVNMLRQDVNVALIGEMRDIDTIATAVTAAETGHLIFSTLHTNNAAQTINRIIDSFPPGQQDQIRMQLAGSLTGIFSQRLIPRVSGGRVPAYELLIANSAVANLIREKRVHEINTVIETGSQEGMVDMNRCLVELVRSGQISVESAYQYSLNPKGLERLI
ncbi:MAG: PilT/PilU family type 4a pilus ATPase [Candidatus Pacebacteria bacterium]|jgi:twitching motility protein PilT|nr:PilT/PilU family type 4a pilus ATPase [Candidatus Paceibacterota bacterium]